jgi:hypothetical protein
MTSELQVAANRENAKKSTGPKTRRGKSRASGNAVRHGLAGASFDRSIPSDVARLARTICKDDADPFRYEQAVTIANSHILLARIRAARIAAIERTSKLASAIEGRAPIPASPSNRGPSASEASDLAVRPMPIDGALEEMLDDVGRLTRSIAELLSLERYERRALSPRKRAIRRFDALGE